MENSLDYCSAATAGFEFTGTASTEDLQAWPNFTVGKYLYEQTIKNPCGTPFRGCDTSV